MVIIVDLDGTLLKSDMLYECFWSAFGTNWRNALLAVFKLGQGRVKLKSYLASIADIDVSTLPYDDAVIAYVRACGEDGHRLVLVTASNQTLANAIAEHLQIFDEVHGSTDKRNLKGIEKAKFLTERFGKKKFCYVGDSFADLHVWKVSQKIVTVNASASLRRKTDALGAPLEHLTTKVRSLQHHIEALRPHQWLKNILVFVPLLLAHQTSAEIILASVFAFIAFNLTASSVYILNDLVDLNADRIHPRKRYRPFASGTIPIAQGGLLAISLLSIGAVVAYSLGWPFFFTLVIYYLLTTFYSLKLKRMIVADICVLAGLYTMRIIAGGVATGIELSIWLIAVSMFFFFSLAAVKRQAELVDMANRGMLVAKGRGYRAEDLPIISMVALAAGYVSVLVMALYVNSPSIQKLYAFPDALWGICSVMLYWLTRIILITNRGNMHDDPVVFAARDRVSQVCLVLIMGFAGAGVLL